MFHYHDNAVKTDESKNCLSEFCGWECVVKKVVKGIVMDPCVQLFTWSTSDKAPKGQNTMSDLFTPTHTHTVSETPKGLTSLRWLTFHWGRRGRRRDTFPHLVALCFLLHLCFLFTLYLQLFRPFLLSPQPLSVCLLERNYPSLPISSSVALLLSSVLLPPFPFSPAVKLMCLCMYVCVCCCGMSWQAPLLSSQAWLTTLDRACARNSHTDLYWRIL